MQDVQYGTQDMQKNGQMEEQINWQTENRKTKDEFMNKQTIKQNNIFNNMRQHNKDHLKNKDKMCI